MSKKLSLFAVIVVLVATSLGFSGAAGQYGSGKSEKPKAAAGDWALDATYIEACSCHLFCPCYFNPHPEHPTCEFNMAVKVNDGHYGGTSLKGVKYWLTGDLGETFGPGQKSPWLIVTFEPTTPKPQRDAIVKILTTTVYPWQWGEVKFDESAFTWEINDTQAIAKLANGKGEMVLDQWKGNDGGKAVLHNVKYFGADSNDGFIMYKSKLHRYDGFGHKFEYSGRNAFVIRLRSKGAVEAAKLK